MVERCDEWTGGDCRKCVTSLVEDVLLDSDFEYY